MLSIENLNKNFGKKQALKNVSISLEPGVYGLLGPNGAGKTTLIRCMTQLYPTDAATITYNGCPIRQSENYLSRVGYLPQKFGLFRDLTVYDALQMLANVKKLPRDTVKDEICRCVEAVNLSDRLHSRVKTLSGGMIKRIGIAQALLADPEILLFDEPTAGLDPEERLRFKLIISALDSSKTVLISTHIVSDIEATCNRVVVLDNGSVIFSGYCEELRKAAEGKVYLVSQDALQLLDGACFIQSQYQDGARIMCRVISSQEQRGEQASPTLEDGYMCLLKGV